MAISLEHVCQPEKRPQLHRDPFDRLLIAQAQCQGLTLLTCDEAIRRYPLDTAW